MAGEDPQERGRGGAQSSDTRVTNASIVPTPPVLLLTSKTMNVHTLGRDLTRALTAH